MELLLLLLLLKISPWDAYGSEQYNQLSHPYAYKNLFTCQKSWPVRTQRLRFQYMCVCVCHLCQSTDWKIRAKMCSEGISVGHLWIISTCSWPGRQEEGPDFHIWQVLSDLTRSGPKKIKADAWVWHLPPPYVMTNHKVGESFRWVVC